MNASSRYLNRIMAGLSLLLLAACAGMGTTPEEAVAERGQQRWSLLAEGDVLGAYEYLSPGYRSSVTPRAYQRKIFTQPIQYREAEHLSSECAEDTCKVTFLLKFTVVGGVPGVRTFKTRQTVEENWIKVQNQWYFVPE